MFNMWYLFLSISLSLSAGSWEEFNRKTAPDENTPVIGYKSCIVVNKEVICTYSNEDIVIIPTEKEDD